MFLYRWASKVEPSVDNTPFPETFNVEMNKVDQTYTSPSDLLEYSVLVDQTENGISNKDVQGKLESWYKNEFPKIIEQEDMATLVESIGKLLEMLDIYFQKESVNEKNFNTEAVILCFFLALLLLILYGNKQNPAYEENVQPLRPINERQQRILTLLENRKSLFYYLLTIIVSFDTNFKLFADALYKVKLGEHVSFTKSEWVHFQPAYNYVRKTVQQLHQYKEEKEKEKEKERRLQAADEARRSAEEEARRSAEEEASMAAAEEAQRRVEAEEKRRAAAEEAKKRAAEEEAKRVAAAEEANQRARDEAAAAEAAASAAAEAQRVAEAANENKEAAAAAAEAQRKAAAAAAAAKAK
jgi:chemotaxis protein histidine kinase CheA